MDRALAQQARSEPRRRVVAVARSDVAAVPEAPAPSSREPRGYPGRLRRRR